MGVLGAVAILAVCLSLSWAIQINGKLAKGKRDCDFYHGEWRYDESYPLYDSAKCNFIENQFNCLKNDRPDRSYLKYMWQPSFCNLPRYSYNATFMLYRSGFLVDIKDTKLGRVLDLGSIEGGKSWRNVDTLIFNTWHWWLHTGRKQRWDFIQHGSKMYKDMDRLVAFEKALTTWAKWVDSNVDTTKTKVVFQGISPDHSNASDWGKPNEKGCVNQNQPFVGHDYPAGQHPAEVVLERVLEQMKTPVYLLNVTRLSQLRIDGHPSYYGGYHRIADCSHWCLAGVPDTWNQLLYATLFQS
ncbi:Trichome birefringence-like, N-terminal domain [Dillenia turbinata]|uniref:Trichome birefringence-like, N-terminal domain n=1 Tax=Dillenia turbinata TaxID=194707 RepID=A0AAN8ULY5_9MAGN